MVTQIRLVKLVNPFLYVEHVYMPVPFSLGYFERN